MKEKSVEKIIPLAVPEGYWNAAKKLSYEANDAGNEGFVPVPRFEWTPHSTK